MVLLKHTVIADNYSVIIVFPHHMVLLKHTVIADNYSVIIVFPHHMVLLKPGRRGYTYEDVKGFHTTWYFSNERIWIG